MTLREPRDRGRACRCNRHQQDRMRRSQLGVMVRRRLRKSPYNARAWMSKCPLPIRRLGKNRRRQGGPMRYLLLIYGNEQAAAAKSPEAQAAEMDAWWK